MTVAVPTPETMENFHSEYEEINAQLDALLGCMDMLEAKTDQIFNAAKQLVVECQQVRGTTSDSVAPNGTNQPLR
ncbi:hypothetical protein CRM22_000348 [Opisthorchis felineus]|uniref:Uncharacterized protein n=1 Tax=Opisthorchis felineus TaxID=147828 RepID=A0A4S2MFQ1_OPIFE|nr:hypothetical protein CRM22_000348 [Opisthorchis felineus]